MDVLELPRPVINFLRTISKEMSRYSLCWDIYGGSESVTLTLTWKINCDESDDEQLAKSRRQHQQQLNTLINMDLNSTLLTDNSTNTPNTPASQIKHKTGPITPASQLKTKQLQHSKLDKLTNQSSSNNCLFSKLKNDNLFSNDSYDPYVDMKKTNRSVQNTKIVPRNYSAESNVFKYEEDLKETINQKQHKSRRPKSSNHSLERGQYMPNPSEEDKIYEFNRSNNEENDDEDEIYEKQFKSYPKKILKYTRGKSLENFEHSNDDTCQYDANDQHRYCQNCTHQASFNKPYTSQYQPQFIPRSEPVYNPHQHHHNHYQQYHPPQQQQSTPSYSSSNNNLIKISSNSTNNNNEKVCLNNQRLVLNNYNPYQNFPFQQQQHVSHQSHYMSNQAKPQHQASNYMQHQDLDKSESFHKNFKTTKQKTTPTSSDLNPNRIVYSQSSISKAACNHNNNSSNTENNSDSSSSENIHPCKKNSEPVCISTSSSNNVNASGGSGSINSNVTASSSKLQTPSSTSNPWIRRNIHTETKENIVSESTFIKTSTTNELTGPNYDYANNSISNTNSDYFPNSNVSLPIMTSNHKNAQNTSGNTNRVTFDPKLDK